ncbi:MAG: Transcriptional regulator, HxlR family [Pseudonocardiales bacterium]|nr:Transcriptional regulator, HxlR family [Pseudonocardiales bacterium]
MPKLDSWSRLRTVRADLGATLRVVGERWALVIVREISLGLHRFDELQEATGAPRAVLSDRLRRLTDAGILATRAYRNPGSRARMEYALTGAGRDLLPVLAAISDWGARHLTGEATRDVDYRHIACGGRVTAELVCECGQRVNPHDHLVAQINR